MAVAHMQHKTCPGCARGFIDGLPFVPNMSMRRIYIYIYIYMRVCYAYPRDKEKLWRLPSPPRKSTETSKKVESRLSSEQIIKIRDVVAFFVRAVKKKRASNALSSLSLSSERDKRLCLYSL